MICLGIDPGQKRIGLALGQGTLALALDAIDSDAAVSKLIELVAEKNVERIYCGFPINMHGQETLSTTRAVDFAKLLSASVKTPIYLIDERLTSAASAHLLREVGISARDSKGKIDSESARLIVEQAIAMNHKAGIELGDYLAGRV